MPTARDSHRPKVLSRGSKRECWAANPARAGTTIPTPRPSWSTDMNAPLNVGLMVPINNTTFEGELLAWLPAGSTCTTLRIPRGQDLLTPATLPAYKAQALELALQESGARNIALVTPYLDAVNVQLKAFLADGGIQVSRFDSFYAATVDELGRITAPAGAELAPKTMR